MTTAFFEEASATEQLAAEVCRRCSDGRVSPITRISTAVEAPLKHVGWVGAEVDGTNLHVTLVLPCPAPPLASNMHDSHTHADDVTACSL